MKLATHLHLVARLRMIGAILPLPAYAFMACTKKTLPALTITIYIIFNTVVD